MIKDEEGFEGVWRTIRGQHVFIRKGEDLDSAMKRNNKKRGNTGTKTEDKKEDKELEKKRTELKAMNDDERLELKHKLSEEEIEEYEKLGKLKRNAYKKGDEEKAREFQRERENLLISKMGMIEKKEDKKFTPKEIKKLIDDNVNYSIEKHGDDFGRFDGDSNTESLYDTIYTETESALKRELTDKELDIVNDTLDKYYKDGYYVAKGSFSNREYEKAMFDKMEKVDNEMAMRDYDVNVSRSWFQGLLASRYYTKDDITVRIGDHPNSTGWGASHNMKELYESSVDDLVKYVESEFKRKKKQREEEER